MKNEGKVTIITGGGQGIGKATAKHLLKQGCRLLIAEVDEEAGRETEQELKAIGAIRFLKTDVSREQDVIRLMEQTLNHFGRIDVLINNAAISRRKPVTELSLEEWNAVLAVNLTGAFLCAKHAVPYLRETKGVILNISSTRALMSEPHTEAYSASKGGILALTHALAMSLGPDIRVNSISPGWIEVSDWKKSTVRQEPGLRAEDHRQHPVGRVGRPEDIASLASYLISPEAGFITGQNFIVDGGMTRKMIYLE
jgi:NAD(P)-dependent dehydrogenase (short-subunit alcohol dehydrogenase family)